MDPVLNLLINVLLSKVAITLSSHLDARIHDVLRQNLNVEYSLHAQIL